MADQHFLRLALPTPLRRLFDYLPAQGIDLKELKPGVRVQVPFASRTLVGVLVKIATETTVPYGKLKPALEVLDAEPLIPPDVFELCAWAAEYYHYALGEVLMSALPTLLRKGKPADRKKLKPIPRPVAMDTPHTLNAAQQQAFDAVMAAKDTFKTFLLDGVTGSGKTEVYLQAIERIIQEGKQVLVLVPEISLTPQTIQRFCARFDKTIIALHSGLSEQERLQAWLAAKAGEASIVIGTRSAIFTPFKNLGLIIVDEEHDTSFKQQDRFRYHARDLAIMRASTWKIPVVLGSATPSLESLLNSRRDRYEYLSMPYRTGEATLPEFRMINLNYANVEEGLSAELLQAMREQLAGDNQVMLFLNRRGFAPVLYCTQCTWIVGCKRCDTRMVYHRHPERLHCHHCDARKPIPKKCEQCQDITLQPVGLGTQRLEQTLAQHFPDVPIIRVDRDSTRKKGTLQALIEQVHTEKKAILLGTQMLAKGHHFPQVTLVGMIEADAGLFSADFRAMEQMGQLLIQVAGRAGRAEKKGVVAIQTRHPDHPLLQLLISEGYAAFSEQLLDEREQAVLPPYSYFAVFRAEAYAEEAANRFLEAIKKSSDALTEPVTLLGPVPALMAKRKGLYCYQLLVRANRRSALQQFLKNIVTQVDKFAGSHPVKWVLDVDPVMV